MRIIRIPETLRKTGYTKSPLYGDIAAGLFTEPVKIGGRRAAGHPEHEVDALVAARIAGKTPAEIRQLVDRLHEARKAVQP